MGKQSALVTQSEAAPVVEKLIAVVVRARSPVLVPPLWMGKPQVLKPDRFKLLVYNGNKVIFNS